MRWSVDGVNSSTAPAARRILVVDDDEAVRTMLVRVLSDAGYVAFPAVNGDDAVRVCERFNIDLVLLDLGLPGEDGWTTLIQLHARNPALPVLIITAWPNQHATAWTAGASGCFEKPLDFGELLHAIAGHLPPTTNPAATNQRMTLPRKETR